MELQPAKALALCSLCLSGKNETAVFRMKNKTNKILLVGFGLLSSVIGFLAAGCSLPQAQPDLTRYFVLTSRLARADDSAATPSEKRWRIGLRAVEVPAFLRNKAMLVRLNRNEVRFMEDARWAEPLDAAITRVLREDLDLHPHVSRVAMLTATSEQARDFDVMVHVLRCEGGRDGDVARFRVRLEILSPDANNQIRAGEVFSTEIPGWNGKDYGQLAQKLSEAVEALSERIVAIAATAPAAVAPTKPRE